MSKTGDVAGVSVDPNQQEVDDPAQSNVKIVKVRKNLDGNGDAAPATRKDSQDYQFTGVNPGSKLIRDVRA